MDVSGKPKKSWEGIWPLINQYMAGCILFTDKSTGRPQVVFIGLSPHPMNKYTSHTSLVLMVKSLCLLVQPPCFLYDRSFQHVFFRKGWVPLEEVPDCFALVQKQGAPQVSSNFAVGDTAYRVFYWWFISLSNVWWVNHLRMSVLKPHFCSIKMMVTLW